MTRHQTCATLHSREEAIEAVKGYNVRKGVKDVLPLVDQIIFGPAKRACSEAMVVGPNMVGGKVVQWRGELVFHAVGKKIKTSKDINLWFDHLERLAAVVDDEANFS